LEYQQAFGISSQLMDRVAEKTVDPVTRGFERICVFCGSSSGKKVIYTDVAVELGTELVRSPCLDLVVSFLSLKKKASPLGVELLLSASVSSLLILNCLQGLALNVIV